MSLARPWPVTQRRSAASSKPNLMDRSEQKPSPGTKLGGPMECCYTSPGRYLQIPLQLTRKPRSGWHSAG